MRWLSITRFVSPSWLEDDRLSRHRHFHHALKRTYCIEDSLFPPRCDMSSDFVSAQISPLIQHRSSSNGRRTILRLLNHIRYYSQLAPRSLPLFAFSLRPLRLGLPRLSIHHGRQLATVYLPTTGETNALCIIYMTSTCLVFLCLSFLSPLAAAAALQDPCLFSRPHFLYRRGLVYLADTGNSIWTSYFECVRGGAATNCGEAR